DVVDFAARDLLQELYMVLRIELVTMHHLQRVSDRDHVQTREISPRAANAVKRPALARGKPVRPRDLAPRNLGSLFQRTARHVVEPQATERQRHAFAHLVTLDGDQFEAAAAKVADNAVRLIKRRTDAKRRKVSLLAPRKNADIRSQYLLHPLDEGRSITRL